MISIKNKQIVFQNEYDAEAEPLPIIRKSLISGFICPSCEKVLLAYFKTDEYIPVWSYDGTFKESNCEYRVFHINGFMGIEVKEHINTTYSHSSSGYRPDEHKSCDLNIYETYNMVEAVNKIFATIESDENKYEYKESKMFRLPKVEAVSPETIEYLESLDCVTIIKNRCNSNILIAFELDKFDYQTVEHVDEYDLERGSAARRKAEAKNARIDKQNEKAKMKAYTDLNEKIIETTLEVHNETI